MRSIESGEFFSSFFVFSIDGRGVAIAIAFALAHSLFLGVARFPLRCLTA